MIPDLISYLIKLTISLSIVYIFYWLVLQNLTFYTWNRFYLLIFTFLSFIIPLVDVATLWEGARQTPLPALLQNVPPVEAVTNNSLSQPDFTNSALNAWDWLLMIIMGGNAILLIRTAIQFLSFVRIRRASHLISDQGIKIYQVDDNILPFSFGRSVFLNQFLHQDQDLPEIIRHELVHVQQGHTIDIIWMELICILNWFNPFVWLLRRQLRQNLEFIADKRVLQSGTDKKQYQYLLLQITGTTAFRLANQFSFSPLKNRIAMMNKIPSNRPELVKFFFLLPVVAFLLLAFRSAENATEVKTSLLYSISNGRDANFISQNKPIKQNDKKNLVNHKSLSNNRILAEFQDGTQETYDISTEAGKKGFRAAQRFLADSYNPADSQREWSNDFKTLFERNPQIAKIQWRYNMETLEKKEFIFGADRLFITLKSGAEEVYAIESKADLARIEKKFGKLPLLPPPPPTIQF